MEKKSWEGMVEETSAKSLSSIRYYTMGGYWLWRSFDFWGFLKDVTCICPLYVHGWYMHHLMICYVSFWCIRRYCLNQNNRLFLFSVISLAFYFLSNELQGEQALSFLTGIFLSETCITQKAQQAESQKKIIAFGITMLLIGIIALGLKQIPNVRALPYYIFLLVQLSVKFCCGLGIVFLAILIPQLIGKTMGYLGIISFEIYLIHGHIMYNLPVSLSWAALALLTTILAACIVHWVFGGMKNLKLLEKQKKCHLFQARR